jgi:hypothetical protein
MRRRTFLLGAGATGTVGSLVLGSALVGPIDVRWWATRAAARRPRLRDRVEAYLERGFGSLTLVARVSYGGRISVPTEDAHRLVVDGTWPRRLVRGSSGGRVAPVSGVNLLVTDGSVRDGPAGAGLPYVAAVGGAREIAGAPPTDRIGPVVPDSPPLRTAQILLHECGHALGLRHDHGSIEVDGAAAVVSPMVSGYAWTSGPVRRAQFDFASSRCGEPYPAVDGKDPRLLLEFDDCERWGINRFRRSELPASPLAARSVEELFDLERSDACCRR